MNKKQIKMEKGLVARLRLIRDKMNIDMQDMSFEEVKTYLQAMKNKEFAVK